MRFLLVADGRPQAGLGHVMRALAIADAARAAGHDVGVATSRSTTTEALGRNLDIELLDHKSVLETFADVVLLDGYNFDQAVVDEFRPRTKLIGAMVDHARTDLEVDLVINPNTSTAVRQSSRRAVQLLGPRYAPLHRQFREVSYEPSVRRSLLVTAGGTDPAGLTSLVLEHLPSRHAFDVVRVVVGPHAPSPPSTNDLIIERQPVDMCQLMASSHAAIGAAGSTVWELCCIGVPAAIVRVARNQDLVLQTVADASAALTFGSPRALMQDLPGVLGALAEPTISRPLAESARALVDGRGADRIVAAVEETTDY